MVNDSASLHRLITGHVTYNLAYTYKYQLKTTFVCFPGFDQSKISNYGFLHYVISAIKNTMFSESHSMFME